ncbi:hypothetical protein CRYUN_Cryun39dG0056800 [Craigia yunnanensis]
MHPRSKPYKLTPLVHLKNFLTMAVAEMAAIGFGLPKDAFTSLMKQLDPYLLPDVQVSIGSIVLTSVALVSSNSSEMRFLIFFASCVVLNTDTLTFYIGLCTENSCHLLENIQHVRQVFTSLKRKSLEYATLALITFKSIVFGSLGQPLFKVQVKAKASISSQEP